MLILGNRFWQYHLQVICSFPRANLYQQVFTYHIRMVFQFETEIYQLRPQNQETTAFSKPLMIWKNITQMKTHMHSNKLTFSQAACDLGKQMILEENLTKISITGLWIQSNQIELWRQSMRTRWVFRIVVSFYTPNKDDLDRNPPFWDRYDRIIATCIRTSTKAFWPGSGILFYIQKILPVLPQSGSISSVVHGYFYSTNGR